MGNRQLKIIGNIFHNRQRGFTIIEVMLAVIVGVIVILLIYASHSLTIRMSEKDKRKIELAQNGRVALDRLTREMRQSDDLVTDLPGEPLDTAPAEIMFQDGHELDPITYVRYYLDGNVLHRESSHYYFPAFPEIWVYRNSEDGAGNKAHQEIDEDQIIAEYIENLIFWGSDRLINIRFDVASGEDSIDFQTTVFGRNLH